MCVPLLGYIECLVYSCDASGARRPHRLHLPVTSPVSLSPSPLPSYQLSMSRLANPLWSDSLSLLRLRHSIPRTAPSPRCGQFNSLAGCQSTRDCPVAKTETMMLTRAGGVEREVDEAETAAAVVAAATAAPAKFRIRFIVAVDVDSY